MSDRLTQLKKLLEEIPGDSFLKYGIGLEYVSKEDDTSGLEYFLDLKNENPDYLALYYQLGKLYERNHQLAKAISTFEEGITIARKQNDTHTQKELQQALDELMD